VPVILGPSIPRGDRGLEERVEWCRAMLILFKPWRCLDDLLLHGEGWDAAFERCVFTAEQLRVMGNIGVLSECKDARPRTKDV
ncbi:hypothetical protein CALVIDRAFT_466384, partial [Calocera viscosa TUFC12733]